MNRAHVKETLDSTDARRYVYTQVRLAGGILTESAIQHGFDLII
jgi:hypothetical protein